MVKVLHVAQPTVAGVHRYVLAVAHDQRRRGWNVHVACPDDGLLGKEVTAAGIHHLRWSAVREPGRTLVDEVRALTVLTRRLRPDVVHLHSAKAGLAGRLGLRGRLPTLFQPHGWSWLATGGAQGRAALAWERYAVRWSTQVIACGEGEAEQGRAAGVCGPLSVVRNGIDLGRFRAADADRRAAARGSLELPAEARVVACPGRLARQKGQDVLLDAWPRIRQACPDAVLVLVGGSDPAGLRGAVLDQPGVRLFGPTDDITTFYAAADVVALPSRWEGLSLTAMEALATGTPLVASAVPGLTELVPPEVGALVPADVPADLAREITVRLVDRDRTARESAAAVEWARGFDQTRTHEALAELTLGLTSRTAP